MGWLDQDVLGTLILVESQDAYLPQEMRKRRSLFQPPMQIKWSKIQERVFDPRNSQVTVSRLSEEKTLLLLKIMALLKFKAIRQFTLTSMEMVLTWLCCKMWFNSNDLEDMVHFRAISADIKRAYISTSLSGSLCDITL